MDLHLSSSASGTRQDTNGRWSGEAGLTLVELIVAMGILTLLMSLVFQSTSDLVQVTQRDSAQAYATSRARAAMEVVVRTLRNDLVQFNNVAATPLGVNVDLDNAGTPVVRDGVLFYVDGNHNAQIFAATGGQPQTAGFDDNDNDDQADVVGIGLVAQDINNDGTQDFLDMRPRDGQPDDLDGDNVGDRLWSLRMVRFNNITLVSNVNLWRQGRVLTENVVLRRISSASPAVGWNIRTFQFAAHNPVAMIYDMAASGGNANDVVEENEIGNLSDNDGIINTANEVASIDSVIISLNVVEVTTERNGRLVTLSGDISSDLTTPRALMLMRRNGISGLANPALASNVD